MSVGATAEDMRAAPPTPKDQAHDAALAMATRDNDLGPRDLRTGETGVMPGEWTVAGKPYVMISTGLIRSDRQSRASRPADAMKVA